MHYEFTPLTPQFIEELERVQHLFYEYSNLSKVMAPFDFDWQVYAALDAADKLVLVQATDDGKMVGSAIYIISNLLHQRKTLIADCDNIAVDPAYRGQGIAKKLMALAEPELINRGVVFIRHFYRELYGTKPMFEDLGYKLSERSYIKEVQTWHG